jgi:hypothetical protein
LGAPHSVYADLRFPENKIVVDVFGFWPKTPVRHDRQKTNENQIVQPVMISD